MSDAFDANGNVDPVAFLAHFGSAGGVHGANEQPYFDPYSPTTIQNPNYNPRPLVMPSDLSAVLSGAGSFAPAPDPAIPGRPYDDQRTVSQPSLADQRNTAEKDALTNTVTDTEKQQAHYQASRNSTKRKPKC